MATSTEKDIKDIKEDVKDTKPLRSQVRFMEVARERLRDEPMLSRQLVPAPSPVAATFGKLRRKGKKKKRDRRGRDD